MTSAWRRARPTALHRTAAVLLVAVLLGSVGVPPGSNAAEVGPGSLEATSEVAGEASEPASASRSSGWKRAADYFVHSFPRHLLEGGRESFRGWNLVALALAGGATGVLIAAGDPISDTLRDKEPLGEAGQDVGSTIGSPAVLFGLTGAAYLAGELSDTPSLRDAGEAALESLCVTGVVTGALKLATHRERPDGSDHLSFPSLHAAGSFAVAASLHPAFGFRASGPGFLAATFVALTRVQEGKHYLSDTVFGAALGTVVGLTLGRLHKEWGAEKVRVLPLLDRDTAGARLVVGF